MSVHTDWLLVRLLWAPCVLWCWQSLPQACSSSCTKSSCGLDIAGILLAPARFQSGCQLPLQVLVHTGHWPHLWRCLLAPGRQIVSASLSSAQRCMLTLTWQCQPACLLTAHASSDVRHPLQATDCCLVHRDVCKHCHAVQAPACRLPRHRAGLLPHSGLTCPRSSVSSGRHAEDLHLLCCRGTEQDLYNILGALYTAVLFVSSAIEPACCCRFPRLAGLLVAHTRVLWASPRSKAHCCLMHSLQPLAPASLLVTRPAEAFRLTLSFNHQPARCSPSLPAAGYHEQHLRAAYLLQ